MLAQISTGLVQLHSRYYGKGPTKAKTHMVDDTVVCVLRGGFTTVERTLLDTGEVESVYQMRRSFQQAMEENFRLIVEQATGRNVIAYMSSIHVDPDLAVELFVLEPVEEPARTVVEPGSATRVWRPEPASAATRSVGRGTGHRRGVPSQSRSTGLLTIKADGDTGATLSPEPLRSMSLKDRALVDVPLALRQCSGMERPR